MEKFKVGDKVYCIFFGWGVVNKIRFNGDYPIEVSFSNDDLINYTIDGRYLETSNPTLSFTEYTLQGFSQERLITLPEVGELCLMRDFDTEDWLVCKFDRLSSRTDFKYITVRNKAYRQLKRIKILD